MARIGVVFNVYASEGKISDVSQAIKAKLNPSSIEAQDVAFGIKILKVFFAFEESENSSSKLESELKNIEGVSEVEVSEESLI